MNHYIAYHKIQDWGEYTVEAGETLFSHYSGHAISKLEKMIGQTVWVISGERINRAMVYKLCSTYQAARIDEGGTRYEIFGEGFGFIPSIELNGLPWFAELFKEQVRFSFGLNQTKSIAVIQGLEQIRDNYLRDKSAVEQENIPIQLDKLFEGTRKQITANKYERNTRARIECLAHYGYDCVICGFNFKKQYGDLGSEYIHVHHLKPVADIGTEYEINPILDLRPVCPNCHVMLHTRKPPYSIEELKQKIQDQFGKQKDK